MFFFSKYIISMYASNIDKKGKKHSSKHVKTGKCVFPFKFKRKEYKDCLDTGMVLGVQLA